MRKRLQYFTACLLTLVLMGGSFTAIAAVVTDVLIKSEGLSVDPSSVRPFLSTSAGDTFSRQQIAKDVKALEKTGRFSKVEAKVVSGEDAKVDVVFVVEAKPRLRTLIINGSDYYPRRKIEKIIALTAGDLVDGVLLNSQIKALKNEYATDYYPNVSVTYGLEPIPGTSLVDVYINVKEGDRSKVKSIALEGNSAVSDGKILRKMEQKKIGIFSFITSSGSYDPVKLETDLLTIRDVFRMEGYLDVEVGKPLINEKGKNIHITIPIEQGELYTLNHAKVIGMTVYDESEVLPYLRLKSGDVASITAIEIDQEKISSFYSAKGYYRTRVRPSIIPVGNGQVDVLYNVTEGKVSSIRDINIRGNTRTMDKVIRRELTLYPGDLLNEVKLRTSTARLRNLGFFSYVNPAVEPTGGKDEYDVTFEVEEQQTGQFGAGVGLSSVENIVGFVELSQGNFNLLGWPHLTGGGQKLRLRMQLGTDSSDYEASFVEPYFLNRKLSLGVDGFRKDREFFSDDYDQQNTGGSVSLSRPVTAFTRARLAYQLEEVSVYNVDETASDLIKQEEGDALRSVVSLSFTRDTRNNFYVATRGSRSRLSGDLAGGPLGFDVDFYNVEFRSNLYVPLLFDHVLSLKGAVGTVQEYGDSEHVPIFDRRFLGGARSVRGFDFREVGPKDEEGEPVGGNSSVYGTVEYIIPLAPKFRLASFYDFGAVNADSYDFGTSDYNSSYGFGVRIDMPGFPLQLDYSWPLEADEFNDRSSGRFSFLIGYFF